MDLRLNPWLAVVAIVATLLVAAAPSAVAAPAVGSGADEGQRVGEGQLAKSTPSSGEVDAQAAIRVARRDPVAIDQAAKNPDLERRARRVDGRWEVGLYSGEDKVGLVVVDAASGEVVESWAGHQVAWKMARGYPGAFGRTLNAPYVFIPLTLIFLIGLIDWRRLRRLVNLDLLVLTAFGISHIFFNRAEIGLSVPLTYPVLLYLMVRMLWLGMRAGRPRRDGLNPVWPTAWLLIATLFLLGFRVGLNVVDSGVADIGYASVVGADRISHGEDVYGNFPSDVAEGDTYGPVTYYAYLPFTLIFGWGGEWDNLPAAHAAAIAFDLGTLALLFLLGCRLRSGAAGRRLGVILAFAWAAYPYTAFGLMSNTNDALVSLFLVAAFLLAARPLARGAVAAAAGLAKFAPLVTAPVLVRLRAPGPTAPKAGRLSPAQRNWLLFAAGFAAAASLLLAQTLLGAGLELFYERTLGYQTGRDSPFSIWGQLPALDPLRIFILAATAALAVACLRWPRRLTLPRAAALCAALLIATQLTAMHWFYLYILWFYPLVLIALTGERINLTGSPFRSQRSQTRLGQG